MKTVYGRTKRTIVNRRSFLRGAGGIALGLPFLESMPTRSAWAQSSEPVFSLFVCSSCGIVNNKFWPDSGGALTSDGLAGSGKAVGELAAYADQLLIVKGIKFPQGNSGCGHAQGLCQVLTGAAHDGGGGNNASSTAASVDTVIADAVNPSGLDPLAFYAGLKGGYINERLSFSGPGQVRSAEGNPYEVYKDLIGLAPSAPANMAEPPADDVAAVVDELALRRNSVNDLVRDQINSLKAQSVMSQSDRERLDRHFDGIRDIETAMASQGVVSTTCSQQSLDESRFEAVDRRERENGAQEELAILHMELAAFAFACNLNRTATLQVGDGTDATVYDVPSNSRKWGMHYVSHRTQSDSSSGSDSTAEAAHAEIDALRLANFKKGLDAFASYSTGTGNLLGSSIVLWTNHISDGPSHSFSDIPIVIAGSGGGFLKQGQFIELSGGGGGGFGGGGGTNNTSLLNAIKTAAGATTGDMLEDILA